MNDIHRFEPLWDEWKVDELLGEGSFGKVYKVHKTVMNTTYYSAVKHISIPANAAELHSIYDEGYANDEESARAFYANMIVSLSREVDTMYQLRGHTNIVSYEDHKIIPKDDMPGYDILIRMELLTSLSSLMKQRNLDTEMVVRLGKDICSGLQVLENRKLVHRDIKPQNIFFDKEGTFKLGDFGTARQMERTTSLMSKKGTYVYMTPEVYRGQEANQTVDIYSLGLVMYRLLNGNRAPFLALDVSTVSPQQSEDALGRRMKGEALPAPAYADEKLAAIILKACAYAPEARYQTAEEMYKALKKYENEKECSATQKPSRDPVIDFKNEIENTVGFFQKTDERTVGGTSKEPTVSDMFQQKINSDLQDRQKKLEEEKKKKEEKQFQKQTEAEKKKAFIKKKWRKGLKIVKLVLILYLISWAICCLVEGIRFIQDNRDAFYQVTSTSRTSALKSQVTSTPHTASLKPVLLLDGVSYEIGNCTARDFINHGWIPIEEEFYDVIIYPYEISWDYVLEKESNTGPTELIEVCMTNNSSNSCMLEQGTVCSIYCSEVDSASWGEFRLGAPINDKAMFNAGFRKSEDDPMCYVLESAQLKIQFQTMEDFNIWTGMSIEAHQ